MFFKVYSNIQIEIYTVSQDRHWKTASNSLCEHYHGFMTPGLWLTSSKTTSKTYVLIFEFIM